MNCFKPMRSTKTCRSVEETDETRGWISRYAWGQDYHDVMRTSLERLLGMIEAEYAEPFEAKICVDTAPLLERSYARAAGLGWIGKNTCLINQGQGSWFFLGEILLSLEFESGIAPPDRCGTCTRCLDACPTNAFIGPYKLDSTKCISYLTIEKRGSIPEDLREGIGNNIFGCDICQDVCPWNRKAPITSTLEFEPRAQLVNPALEWLAELSAEEFREVFRGSPIKRTKRAGLRRNAAIAMGNSGQQKFLPLLEKMAHDEDESVAESARWAKTRLLEPTESHVGNSSHKRSNLRAEFQERSTT